MIAIIFNRPEFEYDVHSLVKAFFPDEQVEMYYTCEEELLSGQKAACMHHGREELERKRHSENWDLALSVEYRDDGVRILLEKNCNSADKINKRKENTIFVGQQKQAVSATEREIAVDMTDRIAAKRALGRAIYGILSGETGKELPWGILIGIRPTKLPMQMLERGKTREEIAEYMRDTFLTSENKIALATEIAEREQKLLAPIDCEKGYSLYIGIPFCPSTCLYCSFTSYPLNVWREQVDGYLDALEREIDFAAEYYRDRPLNSVYIGGGTPTTLEPHQLGRLIKKINSSFDLSDCLEFTVEAGRPDSITREKLAALRENGIDRISVNPQTMKQETLELIGRHHTVEQTVESFRLAREAGFDNINMDLIIGLPGEDIGDVRQTMERLTELQPDNVTIHSLAIKRAARLNIFREYYRDMKMTNTQEHMELCEEYCRGMGLAPYYLYRQKDMAGNMENVGYASEGKAGIYNILIMEERQTILALGAGATTKFVLPDGDNNDAPRIVRVENVKDVKNYLGRVDEMISRKLMKMRELGISS